MNEINKKRIEDLSSDQGTLLESSQNDGTTGAIGFQFLDSLNGGSDDSFDKHRQRNGVRSTH